MTGGCPTGAQLRTSVGRSESPDSSMNTMVCPRALAFFLEPASAWSAIAESLLRRAAVLASRDVGRRPVALELGGPTRKRLAADFQPTRHLGLRRALLEQLHRLESTLL